jgi:hypothetical protein
MSFPWFKKKKTELSGTLTEMKKMLDQKKKVIYKMTHEDEMILRMIREKTSLANQNNITRTKAYLSFYQNHPEIHWSFLAHMVSRNAGWNMTDLKGTCLSRLLEKKEAETFFLFLERGNWLIFNDAYPQLLMYEESLKYGRNLAYLLPHLFVSAYMQTVWTYFWQYKDSALLTVALIINEQNHLDETLIKEPNIHNQVLVKPEFSLQDHLSMNQILFPYLKNNTKISFAGKTIHHFEQLDSRIQIGKDLYTCLFNERSLKKIEQWALNTPHTGSRKDYWPHLFNDINEEFPGKKYKVRLRECRLLSGSPHFYSPSLSYVWKDVSHSPPQYTEWYKDSTIVKEMVLSMNQTIENVEVDYCKTLEKLEMACVAKNVFPLF